MYAMQEWVISFVCFLFVCVVVRARARACVCVCVCVRDKGIKNIHLSQEASYFAFKKTLY